LSLSYTLEEQNEKVRFQEVGKRERRAVDRTPVLLPPSKGKAFVKAKPRSPKKTKNTPFPTAPITPVKAKPSKRTTHAASRPTALTPKKRERVLERLRCAACTEVGLCYKDSMVQCGSCNDVMHRACLGFPAEEPNPTPDGFTCPLCELLCDGTSSTLHLGVLSSFRYKRHLLQQLEDDRVMECDMKGVVKHVARYEAAVAKRCRGMPNGVVRSHLCDAIRAMQDAGDRSSSTNEEAIEDPCLEVVMREREPQCPICIKWWSSHGPDEPVLG